MRSTERRLCLRGASGLVTTVVQSRWALFAQVHQVFSPLTRYLSPCFTARHLIPAESEPASGSVKAAAARISPVHSPGRNLFFCSSVPLAFGMGISGSSVGGALLDQDAALVDADLLAALVLAGGADVHDAAVRLRAALALV